MLPAMLGCHAKLDPAPMPAACSAGLCSVAAAAVPAGWFVRSEPAILVALIEVELWRPWCGQAALLLDDAEAARVERRRVRADRETLTIAYALHRLLLGRMLGREPQDVPLYRDRRGCPRLVGRLAHTSLSHADGLVAVAMTRGGAVGVDIERARRVGEMPPLARRICHRDDAAAIAGLDTADRDHALLALWVRKEAALKALGIGLAVEMDEFAAPADAAFMVPLPACDVAVQARMLEAGGECVGAVVGPPGAQIDCRWLRPPCSQSLAAG